MEKEIIIEKNWDIKFRWINDRERFEKICIIVNDEIYSILIDPKTELSKVMKE